MKNKGVLYLFITSIIWGSAFIAQRTGMDQIGPYTYVFFRYMLASFCSLLIFFISLKKYPCSSTLFFRSVRIGILTGLPLAAGMVLQQVGLVDTSAGKAGFLTAMYILIVPLLGLFRKKKPAANVWLALLIALVGYYFLCVTENFSIQPSDMIILGGALSFSLQIDFIDRFGKEANSYVLTAASQFTVLCVAFVLMTLKENFTLSGVLHSWFSIFYCGVFSGAIAEMFQVLGQKSTAPSVASLIMSLESVFSAIFGFLLLHETLSVREVIGCALVFGAVLLSQMEKKD